MYVFTDEQEQLRETVRRFFSDNSSTQTIRDLMESETGYEPSIYQALMQELGLGGIHVPEPFGGAGLSYVEQCIVLEEMGRSLLPSPYLSSCVLAVNAVLTFGNPEQQAKLLPPIVSGERLATVALYDQRGPVSQRALTQNVVDSMFTGEKHFVTDGQIADQIFVIAPIESSSTPQCWLVEGTTAGINRKKLTSIDSTRQLATLRFEDVPVEPLGPTENTETALNHWLDLAYVAIANEMVGGAQALLDSAVQYSKERVQFGRTIGSMQAIKHKCADLLLEVELARSAAYTAAHSVALSDPDLSQHACIAKSAANDAYMKAAADTIQVHGGIGFTWDNDTHLWFKRAKSSQVLFGNSEFHREQLLAHILLSTSESITT